MLLKEEHIFTIKTKDALNVASIKSGGANVVISGINVLRDQIKIGNLVFIVFGGDKPSWATGFVGMAVISREPYDDGYDANNAKNFRVDIDVKVYFDPPLTRADLVSYPDTFDTIGIGPITKWEPNQAITSVGTKNAIGLLQATCDLRPSVCGAIRDFLGDEAVILDRPINRFVLTTSNIGDKIVNAEQPNGHHVDLRAEFVSWAPNKKPGRNGKAASSDTIKKYIGYLACLTKPVETHGNTAGWNGLYEFLHGKKPPLCYYEIDSKDRLDEVYGFLHLVFDGGAAPDGVDADNLAIAQAYFSGKEMRKHACLPSAYEAYEEFLEWREGQKNGGAVQPTEDLLNIALQAFKEHRSDPDWACPPDKPDWGYVSVNKGTRVYYDKLKKNIANLDVEKVEEIFTGVKDAEGHVEFKPMWSGSNGTGWNSVKRGLDTEPEKTIAWIKKYAESPADVLVFATKEDDDDRPSGFGKSVESELLMKFHPYAAIKCGTKTMEVLEKLHLMSFKRHGTYDEWEYQQVLGIAADIKLRMDKIGITRTLEDNEKSDYITVNEFIAWCKENMDLIKETIMNQKLKTVNSKARLTNGTRKLSDAFKDDMMKRLAAALRTKPFAILAGHSGTGKSQLVRRLAYMTCNNKDLIKEGESKTAPGNYCMVQVKPNWHDSTDLLGYYSDLNGRHFVNTPFLQFLCKAYAYPETPFFLCLDEMNLAPVEQYFAEYLSAVESLEPKDGAWLSDPLIEVVRTNEKDERGNAKPDPEILAQIMSGEATKEAADWISSHGVTIPKNLFVVGTVNMDETTCQFSRKVLDRAMTLLMNEAKFADMNTTPEPNKEGLLDENGIQFFLQGVRRGFVGSVEAGMLDKVNESLVNTPFVVAYRFANEYALYEEALAILSGVEVPTEDTDDALKAKCRTEVTEYADDALDQVVLMKLLPRIHGMRDVVKGIFEGRKIGDKSVEGLLKRVKAGGLSAAMMAEITKRSDEYLTFWP